MKTQKRLRLAQLAQEIAFCKQALKAQVIRVDLEMTPEDRIRHLEQQNYWYRRLLIERDDDELDYTTVMEYTAQPSLSRVALVSSPTFTDKRGTHSEECTCKRCGFNFRQAVIQ